MKFPLIILMGTCIAASTEREAKGLSYRPGSEDLNIDHIILLWNRSVTEEATTMTTQSSTTKFFVEENMPNLSEKPIKLRKPQANFFDRLSFCIKKQKYSTNTNQAIYIRCLKSELVDKINDLVSQPSHSIQLFNGYMEFEKLQQPVSDPDIVLSPPKKYSARVSSKKPLSEPLIAVPLKQAKSNQSQNNYYESYQKMLKELVARKSGLNATREKREEKISRSTLEKSAKFFESGRQLMTEISNNLEQGKEDIETFTETILDPSLISSINNFTKTYSLRLNFYPGIAARMKRNENNGVTFDLELDDLNEVEETDSQIDGGRGKQKKKKKVSKKTLKKLFPYLLIPFMIQAALLPIVLKFLLFVAIKALIAGKLALILVAFNAIRNASLKSDEEEYVERMSYAHYGYPGGEEYGAWVNRRAMETVHRRDGIKPADKETDDYAEPYDSYKPEEETTSSNVQIL